MLVAAGYAMYWPVWNDHRISVSRQGLGQAFLDVLSESYRLATLFAAILLREVSKRRPFARMFIRRNISPQHNHLDLA